MSNNIISDSKELRINEFSVKLMQRTTTQRAHQFHSVFSPACKKTDWLDAGMVMCLGQGADLHMAQLMPLPLTISCSSKSRLVLPSWYYLSGAGSPG